MIDFELVNAVGLSVLFVGVMLSFVTIATYFFIHKLPNKRKFNFRVVGLILGWTIFIALSTLEVFDSFWADCFFACFLSFFIVFVVLLLLVLVFFYLKKERLFGQFYVFSLVFFTILGIFTKIIFSFFKNPYLCLIQRIIIIIPLLLGYFMIIKSYLGEKND